MFRVPLITNQNPIEAVKSIDAQPISCNNWEEKYPYAPKVQFRMGHTGKELVVRFEVEEQVTQALVDKDNGEVWTDSCVELFMALDQEGYYNFETNCIGRMLAAWRVTKPEPRYLSEELMQTIERYPSLGNTPFVECEGDNIWSLTLKIPCTALFMHKLESWSGCKLRMNLYKCGDNLSMPHFLSWQRIEHPTPNFHLPNFFVDAKFE